MTQNNENNKDSLEELDIYFQAISQRKAQHVVALDLRGISNIADFFIICSGKSSRQVSAIAEEIQRFLKNIGIKSLGVEGGQEGQWALLDYCDVVIHVFYEPVREFYNLEGLWAEAPRIQPPFQEQGDELDEEDDEY